jgi:MerR family transcriptional regulator, copper efflux regulator
MNNKQTTYHVGDVASATGLSTRAIRYYEELGLVQPQRTDGGFRLYAPQDVEILKTVIRFKELGMSLEEICSLVAHRGGHAAPENLRQLRAILSERRQALTVRVEKYREGIAHIDRILEILAKCDACKEAGERERCDACVRERGADIYQLLETLF